MNILKHWSKKWIHKSSGLWEFNNTLLEDQSYQTDSLNQFIIRKFWINTPKL